MKKILFTILVVVLAFNTTIQITGCGPSQAEIDANKTKVNDSGNDSTFVDIPTVLVKTNIDTQFFYRQDSYADFVIVKIPFENKLITVLYATGSASDFKIISVDTNNTIIPNFKKP